MTTVLCFLAWVASLSDRNKSGMLCVLAWAAFLSSCVSGGHA